jgi:uncharacterized protein (DUF885 family)
MDNAPSVSALADRVLDLVLEAEPLEATLLGFRHHDGRLADLSSEHEREKASVRAEVRAAAHAVDTSSLSEEDRTTLDVIVALLDYADDTDAAGALDFTVAAFPVSPSSMLLMYLRMVVLTDATQADLYLQRLSEVPRYLGQAQERLHRGRVAGLTPVAHLIDMAVDQIDRFLATSPSPLAITPPPGWDGADAWRIRLADVLERDVVPAFEAYRSALVTEARPTARPDDEPGLIHLPDGLARYRRLIRVHTTTERTPEDLHETGLAVVAQIHEEFAALGGELFGTTDVHEIFARLQADPALRWGSSQEILDASETAVRRAEAVSVDWFGRVPSAVCTLEAIPELEADSSGTAYYMPPSLDGSRPGTYYTNVSKPTERTSFDLESVAFHEAVPGHHFQLSLALELPGLPEIRRLTLFNAYAEGWGLYSERLADEMGLYSSPLQRIGMLSADVWRASRLVVDTGLHAFGWSRQRAIDYMLENTPAPPVDVVSEVDRYIAYPGQALSYMTGRLEIERLRAAAQAALGDDFDVKAFHDAVLGSGALPLSVLGDVIDAWIESQQSRLQR